MAKTLIEFQNKLIDIYLIKVIERAEEWNSKTEEMEFVIHFNKSIPESPMNTIFSFAFKTEELRDEKYEELKEKLEDVEYLVIL